ncbi:MAG: tetratricopeptide repeat protein [Pirellulaceae bacterium]
MWDPRLGEEMVNLKAHDHACWLSISPDGTTVATGSLGGEVKLWESQPIPVDIQQRRMLVAQANRVIEGHMADFQRFDKALQSLRSSPVQNAELQSLAEEILVARGPNVFRLNIASRELTFLANQPSEVYQQALQLASAALDVVPDSPTCQTTVGLAYCRLGQYQEAIEYFNSAAAIYGTTIRDTASPSRIPPEVVNVTLGHLFSAISDHSMGDLELANQHWIETKKITSQSNWAANHEIASVFLEVQTLFEQTERTTSPQE